jgi:hypothetical protein
MNLIKETFNGYITEFKFWKQKFSINEIRDGYKTPLAIVAEKKKSFKMKFKEKKKYIYLIILVIKH